MLLFICVLYLIIYKYIAKLLKFAETYKDFKFY